MSDRGAWIVGRGSSRRAGASNAFRALVFIAAMTIGGAAFAAGGDVAGRGQTLVTPRFRVTIEVRCAEGNVTCDDVRYRGVNRRNGSAISLSGRTHHALCADGVTPCRFLGYVFRNGRVQYFVGDDGQLRVTDGEKVLVDERGDWQ